MMEWWEAPVPRWWHRCQVYTKGVIGLGGRVQVRRCACGAIKLDQGPWLERNTRKEEG